MSTASVFTYKRGDTYISNRRPKKDENGKLILDAKGRPEYQTFNGLVSKIYVHGWWFETLERMDGYMHMKGGQDYHNSKIFWHKKYNSYVINPNLGVEQEKTKNNILFHPATLPSHLEGCVAVGFFDPKGVLDYSKESFEIMWDFAGGGSGDKSKILAITLRVEGNMPRLSACKKWAYTG